MKRPKISEYLLRGREKARTCKELIEVTGLAKRRITKAIEAERRAGVPICAACTGKVLGYYLASSDEELASYCQTLLHRETELAKTRTALMLI